MKRKMLRYMGVVTGLALVLGLALILAACTASGQGSLGSGQGTPESGQGSVGTGQPLTVTQVAELPTFSPAERATRDAQLDNTGRSPNATAPVGVTPATPATGSGTSPGSSGGGGASKPTSVTGGQGQVGPGTPVTVTEVAELPTFTPAERATRDAQLEGTGLSPQQPRSGDGGVVGGIQAALARFWASIRDLFRRR